MRASNRKEVLSNLTRGNVPFLAQVSDQVFFSHTELEESSQTGTSVPHSSSRTTITHCSGTAQHAVPQIYALGKATREKHRH